MEKIDYKFINLLPQYALIVDEQTGIIKYCNTLVSDLFSDTIIGKNLEEFISIDDFSQEGIYTDVSTKSNLDFSFTGEMEIRRLLNDNDLLISFKQDQSEKINRYKEIFEHAAEGIVVVNKKLKVLEVNKAFCDIVEINKEDLIDKSAFKLAYKYASQISVKQLISELTAVLNGKSLKNFNFEYIGKTLSISLAQEKGNPYLIGQIRDITENAKSNLELKKSEEKYKSLVESSLDGITIIVNGYISFINPMMSQLFGYSEAELIGSHFINLVSDQEKERVFDIFKNLSLNFKDPIKYISSGKTKKNTVIDLEVIVVPVEYTGKKALQVILRDITEKLKADTQLKNSEEKFKFLSKSTFEGILVHDKGKIIEVNDSFVALTGYSRDESIGENIIDYIPYAKDKALALFYMAKNNASPYVISIKTKSGKSLKVEIQAKNVTHQGKKVRIAAVRDVTEREKIQQKLEESEKRYRAVFENTGSAGCILEEDGTISLANSKFAELSGYSIEEIQNKKSWMDFVYPDDLNRMMEQHKLRRKDQKKALTQYEFTFIDKFKNKKQILLVIDMIEKSKKSVASLTDISYLKETELKLIKINKELKEAKEKAEESDQLKSSFLANMSHEIRTPMNGILGFASLLEEPDISFEEQKQYVEVIKRGGQRMLDTVNDLIDISKIETGQVKINISSVNINSEINNLYQFFKPEAEKKGLKLLWEEMLNKNDEWIKTDDQKLISILTNLIKNAIKYTDKGQIEIKVNKIDEYIHFNVIDTGIGIPKARLEAVFNRFEQVDFTDARAFDGSGLGLAISKAYTEMLGGKIGVHSEFNKGSDFYFTLPAK